MVDVVAGTVATNYDTATSHTITVRETLAGALNSPRDTVLTINVTDAGALGPFTLAWTSAASELTNLSFSITPAPLVGDVVTLSLDGNSDMSSPFDTSDANTIDSGEAASGSLTFTGIATPLSAGLTYATVLVVRGALSATSSPPASITLTAAPALSSPTGTKTGSTTATLTVSTNEANGTLYGSASASAPSKAQIKLGQDSTGAASTYPFNQPVSATGVQTRNATGLTPATTYTMHYMHENATSAQSNVASASSFTTDAASSLAFDNTPEFGTAVFSNADKTVVFSDGEMIVRVPTVITGKVLFAVNVDSHTNYMTFGIFSPTTTPIAGLVRNTLVSAGWFDDGTNDGFVVGADSPGSLAAVGTDVGLAIDGPNGRVWITKDGTNFYGVGGTGPLTKAQVEAGTSPAVAPAPKIAAGIYAAVGKAYGAGGGGVTLMTAWPWSAVSGYTYIS